MSQLLTSPSPTSPYQSLRRFSVAEYHRMIETGILDESDKVELLEGHVVLKMPRNPPHDGTIQVVRKRLALVLPAGWDIRVQSAITLSESEPEPDLAIVRGDERAYLARHPAAADVSLIIEVADSSLDRDRSDKGRIYASAGITIYWIVNIVNRQVELYTAPTRTGLVPAYAQRQDFTPGTHLPLVLDGILVASVPVVDLLP